MQQIVNLLSGKVKLTIECAYPERFLNLCARHNIAFWDITRIDGVTIELSMTSRAYKRLSPLLDRVQAEIRGAKRRGAPTFLRRFRKRYALIGGFLLALAITWVMSLYIWDIRVVGNEEIPQAVILGALEDLGVHTGAFASHVRPEALRNEVLLQLEDLEWITINVNGSRATVIVRERVHPPDRIPEGVPTAVYATRGGVIDQMIISGGTPLVELGDMVEIGQDLIIGRVDSLAYGTYFLRADARIYARTWYAMSMSMPLERDEKVYTGEISTKSIIFFGQSRINIFFDSGISYASYGKIVETFDFVLPGGIILPIRHERRTYTEYEILRRRLDETKAALLLQERLLERLREQIGHEGQIIRTDFRVEVENGIVTVHLEAECREQIAAIRRLEEAERIATPNMTEEEGAA